jgi:hypothetical protein
MTLRQWANRLRGLAGRTSVHVVAAVVVMGGWAVAANRAHGASAALTAGLVQSAASALVTYTLKTSLETMARGLHGKLAVFVPPTVTCAVVLALLVTAHRLAGTRELWSTIAVPYAASSAYAWIYTVLLARA